MKRLLDLVCIADRFSAPVEDQPIVMPFGDYPYDEPVNVEGRLRSVVQRFDLLAANALATRINTAAAEGKHLPIYAGHPDVPDLAHKYPDKGAWAFMGKAEVDPDAGELRIHPMWNEQRPRKGAFRWQSPYWSGATIGEENGVLIARITDIKSLGMTNQPKIYHFRLPNERLPGNTQETDMKEKLIALLGLAADATDDQVNEAITALKARADDAEGKVTALEKQIEELTAEKTSAEEGKATAETALANERSAHNGVLIDLALADGRITPALKPLWAKRLSDSPDTNRIALANEQTRLKVVPSTDHVGRKANDQRSNASKIIDLVNEQMTKTGVDYDTAYAAIKAKPEHKLLFTPAT